MGKQQHRGQDLGLAGREGTPARSKPRRKDNHKRQELQSLLAELQELLPPQGQTPWSTVTTLQAAVDFIFTGQGGIIDDLTPWEDAFFKRFDHLVLLLEQDGRILLASPSCHKLLKFTQQQLVSRNICELVYWKNVPAVMGWLRQPDAPPQEFFIRKESQAYVLARVRKKTTQDKTGKPLLVVSADIVGEEVDPTVDPLLVQRSRERFRAVLLHEPNMNVLGLWSTTGLVHGMDPKDWQGILPHHLMHPADIAKNESLIKQARESHCGVHLSASMINRKTGLWELGSAWFREIVDPVTKESLGQLSVARSINGAGPGPRPGGLLPIGPLYIPKDQLMEYVQQFVDHQMEEEKRELQIEGEMAKEEELRLFVEHTRLLEAVCLPRRRQPAIQDEHMSVSSSPSGSVPQPLDAEPGYDPGSSPLDIPQHRKYSFPDKHQVNNEGEMGPPINLNMFATGPQQGEQNNVETEHGQINQSPIYNVNDAGGSNHHFMQPSVHMGQNPQQEHGWVTHPHMGGGQEMMDSLLANVPPALLDAIIAQAGNHNCAFNQQQPFATNQQQPFATNQQQPFATNQQQPFATNQQQSFATNQQQPFATNQQQPFAANQQQPFATNQDQSLQGQFPPRPTRMSCDKNAFDAENM